MLRLPLLVLSLTSGCLLRTESRTRLPDAETERLARTREPALTATFQVEPPIVRGHAAWANTCQRVRHGNERIRVESRSRHSRVAGAIMALGGVAAGAVGVAMIDSADRHSARPHCRDSDGDGIEECSSHAGDQTILGLILTGGAVALAGGGLYTLAAPNPPPTQTIEPGAPLPPTVLPERVACGSGPVKNLGVSLYRGPKWLSASTTDANGNVGLAIPPGVSGQVEVVVDFVSPASELVLTGTVLAELSIAPESAFMP